MKNLLREYINFLIKELDEPPREPKGTLGMEDVEPPPKLSPEQQEKWGWMHPRGQRLALKYASRQPDLPPEAIARLGIEKDGAIAEEFGIPIEMVQWAKIRNSPEILQMLGKVSDIKLADLYDVPQHLVSRERLVRGIRGTTIPDEIAKAHRIKPRKPIEPSMDIDSDAVESPEEMENYSVFDPEAEKKKASDIEGIGFSWEEPDY
jgi:hypothetical protein